MQRGGYHISMKIGVIQLSDMHIKTSADAILKRSRAIVASALGVVPSADAYVLMLSGDVAFSGQIHEYELARAFIGEIQTQFAASGRNLLVAMTPGNHDANFKGQPDTRPRLLAALKDDMGNLDPEGETVKQVTSVQSAFYDFEATILNKPKSSEKHLLYSNDEFPVGPNLIRINTYNTAWVSTNPEIPGQLVFPSSVVAGPDENAALTISMFHHPYNWLSPDSARAFRRAIEASSDIVLTGHEHESDAYSKTYDAIGSIQYVEGAVLQESNTGRSGFNVLCIDTTQGSYESSFCELRNDLYVATRIGSHSFVKNRLRCKGQFHIREQFFAMLNDPVIPVLHPRKRDVQLDDLFIYPTVSYKTFEKPTVTPRIVYSEGLLDHVRNAPHSFLVGDDLIGKSSLARRLYRDLHSDGNFIPISLSAIEFDGFSDRAVRKIIRGAADDQYGEGAAEKYFAIDQGQRALILDDWHDIGYNQRGKAQIARYLISFFGKIIIFTNRPPALEEIVEPGSTKGIFTDFEYGEIKEFGKRLTGRLIEKWHALGRENSLAPSDFYQAVASSEHSIGTVIGHGLLPAYPIFLIGLLQADASPSQNVGSYGHVLEALVTARLSEVSTGATDIGLMYTYLSRIANFQFQTDRPFVSKLELGRLHAEYCALYKLKLDEGAMLKNLLNAKILIQSGDTYKFRYRGTYCYFVARYFSEQINDNPSLRSQLNDVTDKLVFEDFTWILMFYLYLTRDAELIERLLANAERIYADCEPSKLEGDVDFVNKLLTDKPEKLLLPSTDITANRERFRLQQDEAEGRVSEEKYRTPVQRVAYSEGLDEIVKVNIALQSMRVMGQVLRNFPGVLTGEPKFRLTEACYLVGMRILGRFLQLAKAQRENLRTMFACLFKERHPLATDEDAARSADQALIWLAGATSYGVIKRICNSVGLRDLELTFEDVKSAYAHMTSIRLTHLAIRLEHFGDAPEAEIYEIEKLLVLNKNHFAYKILRDLVAEYLLLHNTDTKVLQRLGEEFDIKIGDPRFQLDKALGSGND
jgi:hypothetical protein